MATPKDPAYDPGNAPGMECLLTYDDEGNAPGIDLSSIPTVLVCALYEKGRLTIEEAQAAVDLSPGHRLYDRMRHLYRKRKNQPDAGDGVHACLRAMLRQMVLHGYVREEDGVWLPTPKLKPNKRLPFVKDSQGWRWLTVNTEHTAEGTDTIAFTRRKQEIARHNAELAGKLAPGREGLRPNGTDPVVVQRIVDRYREQGFIDYKPFYVLRDQHGRILSGRHRLEAAKKLCIKWPEITINVADDAEAVAIALEANMGNPWAMEHIKATDADDGKPHDVPALPKEWSKAEIGNKSRFTLIADAFRKYPTGSNRKIARMTGYSDHTVANARRILEQVNAQFAHFTPGRGRGHTEREPEPAPEPKSFYPTGLHARIYDFLLRHPGSTDQNLQDEFRTQYDERGVTARRRKLVLEGWVCFNEQYGRTRSGTRAKLWEAVPQPGVWEGLTPEDIEAVGTGKAEEHIEETPAVGTTVVQAPAAAASNGTEKTREPVSPAPAEPAGIVLGADPAPNGNAQHTEETVEAQPPGEESEVEDTGLAATQGRHIIGHGNKKDTSAQGEKYGGGIDHSIASDQRELRQDFERLLATIRHWGKRREQWSAEKQEELDPALTKQLQDVISTAQRELDRIAHATPV